MDRLDEPRVVVEIVLVERADDPLAERTGLEPVQCDRRDVGGYCVAHW